LGALKGEFESMLAIHAIVGGYIPKPIWWGSFTTVTDAHYYIYKFYELVDELSEPTEFCETVANLHALSESPNGKFGFHTVTYNGNLPQNNDWASTWEEFFTVGFKHMLEINIERGGSWKEMEELRSAIVTKVIPRLLRPLELNGRTVKPSLVHGDLWCGNTALDTMTGKPSVFSLTHYASPFA
jgi:protein-ribulosamine 3-kinase